MAGKNGKGDKDKSADVSTAVSQLSEFVHSPDSTDKAFKQQGDVNALRLMIMSDDDIIDNAMRYDLPNNRVILAIAGYIQKCVEHNYPEGIEFIKYLCGLLPSRKGRRISLFVDAIIGERKWKEGGQGGGAFDKVKKWMAGD